MNPIRKKNLEAIQSFKRLGQHNPKAMNAFIESMHAVGKDGALSAKFKQILATALSVQQQCEWCIVYHTKKAMDLGATDDELLEACMMTGMMAGGPAFMHSRLVFETIDEYRPTVTEPESESPAPKE
jgi:AhpD family alkylhydroperoxidase